MNLTDRSSDLLLQNVDILPQVIRDVRSRHTFEMVAMVVLPEYIHAIWLLPEVDGDYSKRWSLNKSASVGRIVNAPNYFALI